MSGRWLFLPLLFVSVICSGQVTGRFYLQKEIYARGEPVVLYFEMMNRGASAANVLQADPYSFCSGYQVYVSTDDSPNSVCGAKGYVGGCLSSDVLLPPGKSRTERILLNYEHDVEAPGDYDVEATRRFSFANARLNFFDAAKTIVEVREQLHFRIDGGATVNSEQLKNLAAQLHSRDAAARFEAARTLATLGPRSLEATLLEFAHIEAFRSFAPLAFHKLNTKRSTAALGELLVSSQPGSFEHIESAKYLAETGDPRWFPLLREVARDHATISNYVDAAAQSGGDQAVPFLFELLRSPDQEFTVVNAVSALGYTGSRDAIPILLNLLNRPDRAIAARALSSLQQLTHMIVGSERWSENPQSQCSRWAQWWATSQKSARIYKANECGDFTSLP